MDPSVDNMKPSTAKVVQVVTRRQSLSAEMHRAGARRPSIVDVLLKSPLDTKNPSLQQLHSQQSSGSSLQAAPVLSPPWQNPHLAAQSCANKWARGGGYQMGVDSQSKPVL